MSTAPERHSIQGEEPRSDKVGSDTPEQQAAAHGSDSCHAVHLDVGEQSPVRMAAGRAWMDPATVGAVLLAIVGGVGSGLGSNLWTGVGALVHRPFRHRQDAADGVTPAAPVSSGDQELAALELAPADKQRALALAQVLVTRSEADPEFRQALQGWWDQAAPMREAVVTNTITGGTQYGPVIQGQNFTGLTFGAPAVPPPPATPTSGQNS